MPQPHAPISLRTPDPRGTPLSKIIATLGPASDDPAVIARMIEAGVSVFRLNFSHGSLDDHGRRLQSVREASARLGIAVAALGDLPGPKIRVGTLPATVELATGQDVLLGGPAAAPAAGDPPLLPSTYPTLADEVHAGHRVLINDGAVRMLAVGRESVGAGSVLRCRVTVGGPVTSGKGINLPDTDLSIPAMTGRDWDCVEWAVSRGIDFLALSFVRRAEEVLRLREHLEGVCAADRSVGGGAESEGARIPVIAKIEKPQALAAIDAIIDAADGVMVARGDLGVEMDPAIVPIAQKQIIARCHEWGKPCIVATQMLESMIQSATPTRAEATDVASAIFDGVDAVMLSGETAVGKHPALVVETMRRIILAAEGWVAESGPAAAPPRRLVESRYRTAALAHAARVLARDVGASIIVCWSERGGTARYLSQNDFGVPIIACSSDPRTTRRMALLRGVRPVHTLPPASGFIGDWLRALEPLLLARGWAMAGGTSVVVCGRPLGEAKVTDRVMVHTFSS